LGEEHLLVLVANKLESITIPSTVTEICERTFYNCTMLREVNLHDGIQKIGVGAFSDCISLECITIPHAVRVIHLKAFYNCRHLREVGLHESIQKIESSAFEACLLLERFVFPNLSSRLDTIFKDGKYEDVER